MSLFPLSEEEWKQVHNELPNPNNLIRRVVHFPPAEWTSVYDFDLLKRIRLSRVRLHDTIEKLRNARYALSHAIVMRRFYLNKKQSDGDANHVLADWLSRFYADYVPLQLTSAADHSLDMLLDLYDLREKLKTYGKKEYRLKRIKHCFEDNLPRSSITLAITEYDESSATKEIRDYRDKWVHNKPPRVESILHNPPLMHGVDDKELTPWPMALMGYETDFDYKWEQFIELLKEGLSDIITLVDKSADEWETIYKNAGGEFGKHPLDDFMDDE